MMTNHASAITKAASKQTYSTIKFLVDRERVDDAYRAYAYFRWVDDVLDADSGSRLVLSEVEASERQAFLERQKSLLERCYQGKPPRDVNTMENMLVELVQTDHEQNSGLQTYLRNMMQVMEFDARRRGRLISQVELNEYTYWLASAVTEALHYFIGHEDYAPQEETRFWPSLPRISHICCAIHLMMCRPGRACWTRRPASPPTLPPLQRRIDPMEESTRVAHPTPYTSSEPARNGGQHGIPAAPGVQHCLTALSSRIATVPEGLIRSP